MFVAQRPHAADANSGVRDRQAARRETRAACYDRVMSHGPSLRALPLRNFSRLEYDKMIDAGVFGEGEHVELVGGAIVEMSPEGPHHAGTIDLIAEILRRTFGPGFTIRVQHPLVIDPDGEPEPDLAVVAGEPRAHLDAHPRSAALVVEVAESSLAYDRREKALLYARAAIPEYWIVNLAERVLEVHREPKPGGYAEIATVAVGDEIVPIAASEGAEAIAVSFLLP
jgi:Uma2 family endonuclease